MVLGLTKAECDNLKKSWISIVEIGKVEKMKRKWGNHGGIVEKTRGNRGENLTKILCLYICPLYKIKLNDVNKGSYFSNRGR